MTTRVSRIIKSEADREWIVNFARKTATGTIAQFRKATRSNEQNEKMWAMLAEISEQVVWYGEKLPPEDWKDIFTASLRHARVVPGIDKGTFVPLGMRTSQMTIEEMSNLIELMHAFGAEHGVSFRDPGEVPSSPSSEKAGGESPQEPPANPVEQEREAVRRFAKCAHGEARGKAPVDERVGMLKTLANEYLEEVTGDRIKAVESVGLAALKLARREMSEADYVAWCERNLKVDATFFRGER